MDCDVIILGCGPAGERAAIQAAKAGKRVAVIERAPDVGGSRINWGTIPSKTLRESALFVHSLTRLKLHGIRCEIADEITVGDFMYRERVVVQRELEIINEALAKYRVEVLRGHGRFLDTHTIEIESTAAVRRRLTADYILIATGSSPNHPPDVPFDQDGVLDSNSILRLSRLPRTMLVLGAGVVGVEYASIFAALGIQVTLIDTRERLLPYLDREIIAILERELMELGVAIQHGDRYATIERRMDAAPQVRCVTRRGIEYGADVLLYCVGRDGNTRDLGLDRVGLQPNAYGLLEVNEHFQTAHPHIYAVGDVIGFPALASTSMEQGRRAIRHAFGIKGVLADTEALPFAVYSIPEVSYIGETEERLIERGADYVVGKGQYGLNPRGQIIGDTEGLLKLIFDATDGTLLGVHIVGSGASELIHIGQAWLRAGATCHQIAESLYNYPSLSDLYRHAALVATGKLMRRNASSGAGS